MAKEATQKIIKLPALARRRRSRPPSHCTALVIEGQTLRVVQASTSGGRTHVTRVAAAPLDIPGDAEAAAPNVLGPAISRALGRLKIRPGSVVMGVPRAQVPAQAAQIGRRTIGNPSFYLARFGA